MLFAGEHIPKGQHETSVSSGMVRINRLVLEIEVTMGYRNL